MREPETEADQANTDACGTRGPQVDRGIADKYRVAFAGVCLMHEVSQARRIRLPAQRRITTHDRAELRPNRQSFQNSLGVVLRLVRQQRKARVPCDGVQHLACAW